MKALLHKLHPWLWRVAADLAGRYRIEYTKEVPDELAPRTLYLIGTFSRPWSVALLCPCCCGAPIQLSLLHTDSPRWRIDISFWGLVTIQPSIWRTTGCRSHFFMRAGHVIWVRGEIEFQNGETPCGALR